MAKISFADILSGYATASSLNTNFSNIESEFQDKVLYRNNPVGEPNQMLNDLDMNSNDVLNVANLTAQSATFTGNVHINGSLTVSGTITEGV